MANIKRKGTQNKVQFAAGTAWTFNENGKRIAVTSLDQANQIQSECCGINCCEHWITMPVVDANSTDIFPGHFQFVKAGSNYQLILTVNPGSGPITKTITFS